MASTTVVGGFWGPAEAARESTHVHWWSLPTSPKERTRDAPDHLWSSVVTSRGRVPRVYGGRALCPKNGIFTDRGRGSRRGRKGIFGTRGKWQVEPRPKRGCHLDPYYHPLRLFGSTHGG